VILHDFIVIVATIGCISIALVIAWLVINARAIYRFIKLWIG
jgi:hypothetical protein